MSNEDWKAGKEPTEPEKELHVALARLGKVCKEQLPSMAAALRPVVKAATEASVKFLAVALDDVRRSGLKKGQDK